MPRLLIVKTSSLGDVIHNLPILADIRTHFPNIKIDWVVEESFAEIPRLHPAVDQVFTVAMRRWRKNLLSKSTWKEIAQVRSILAKQHYDYVLDTQGLLKSAIISGWAKGVRHGQDASSAREPLAARFYQQTHFVAKNQHAVTRNRQLAALAVGYPSPNTLPDYGIKAIPNASEITFGQNYVIALHGTSRDSKLWPTEQWIDLGKRLNSQHLLLALPWGNATEKARAELIASKLNNALVLPKLGIAKIAEIIAGAKAAVGVDTGLVHLAVALKKPTVAIYTDTNPDLTGVLAGENTLAINLGNMRKTPSVDEVYENLAKMLS